MEYYLKPGATRLLKHLLKPKSFVLDAGIYGAYIGDINQKCEYFYKPHNSSFISLLSKSFIYKFSEGLGGSGFYKITDLGASYLMGGKKYTK